MTGLEVGFEEGFERGFEGRFEVANVIKCEEVLETWSFCSLVACDVISVDADVSDPVPEAKREAEKNVASMFTILNSA